MKEPEKLSTDKHGYDFFTDVPISPHYTTTASLLMPPPLPTNNRPFTHPHCLLPPTRISISKTILKPSLFPHQNPSSSTKGYYYIKTNCPLLPINSTSSPHSYLYVHVSFHPPTNFLHYTSFI